MKYAGLVFGIAFSTLLITQQASIGLWLIGRAANPVLNVAEAQIWVMDPRVRAVEQPIALPTQDLFRVRGVAGVEWAVPFYRGAASVQTLDGRVVSLTLIGLDDDTLIGGPRGSSAQQLQSLRAPGAIVLDKESVDQIWPGTDPASAIGRTLEINDNRVIVVGLADALPGFGSANTAFITYTEATRILPQVRNQLSYVLAGVESGADPAAVTSEIAQKTGLKAQTRDAFLWESIGELASNGGIVPGFATTIALGVIVGVAVTGLTMSLFVQENLRQFGALKAIGVTNGQILAMLAAQTALVGVTGFGFGVGGTAFFVSSGARSAAFEGIVLFKQVVWGCAALMVGILVISAAASIRRVLKLEPAEVFR